MKSALAGRDDRALIGYERLAGASDRGGHPRSLLPVSLRPRRRAGRAERAKTVYEGFQSGTLSMRCVQFG